MPTSSSFQTAGLKTQPNLNLQVAETTNSKRPFLKRETGGHFQSSESQADEELISLPNGPCAPDVLCQGPDWVQHRMALLHF